MSKINLNYQHGFTIIEIMVAVTLSLIVLAGVIQIYFGSKATSRLQEASSEVQESGRFAIDFISKDVRMAGYIGCANSDFVAVSNNVSTTQAGNADARTTAATFDGTNGIIGYDYDGIILNFPADLTNYGLAPYNSSTPVAGDVIGETSIIYMQGARGCQGGDIVCHNNASSTVKACPGTIGNVNSAEYRIANNDTCQIAQNDIVLLSNCVTADIHAVTNNPSGSNYVTIGHGSSLNNSSDLTASYGSGSSIYKMSVQLYYIGMGTSGRPALFRSELRGNTMVAEELVEGIYDMAITYGEDPDADNAPNRYVEAEDVTNWEEVISARISLFTRSRRDDVAEVPTTYRFDAGDVTDSRLRREFTSTITLRNRVK